MTPPMQNTATYFGNSPVIRVLRMSLGATQRLWPALAVRSAHRLFGTPLPPRWLRRKPRWSPDWRIQEWPFERASLTVYERPAAPHGPVVLLVHGWAGHAGQLLALADALSEKGLRPVIVEMPAHGRSAGTVSNLPQFARALDYMAARLQQQGHTLQAVVAHSLGANAAAYAASRGLPVHRLVLLAPPASPYEFTRLFAQVFGLSEATRAAMQRRVESREGILMPQFEPAAVGPRIQVPTLVVHDEQDRINRFGDGVAYSRAIANARLHATQGLGHSKLMRDRQVIREITDFMD